MPRPPARRRRPNQPIPITSSSIPHKRLNKAADNAARRNVNDKLAKKSTGERLSDSDDSDKLVTKKSDSIYGTIRKGDPVYMSGAVAHGDKPSTHPRRDEITNKLTKVTNAILASSRSASRESTELATDQNKVSATSVQEDTTRPKRLFNRAEAAIIPPAVKNSAVKANSRSQPTPLKESSILGGIKPRKRQPSILRLADESSLLSSDVDLSLPDLESTPLNLTKSKAATVTPSEIGSGGSSSKKRKFATDDPLNSSALPVVTAAKHVVHKPLEPTLPPMPISALRSEGQKQRRRTLNEDDIMAPPASSSSIESPQKPKTPVVKAKRIPNRPPASMSTEQLQALMPTKRRKTALPQRKGANDFDIPEDSDERVDEGRSDDGDDSSFLPVRKGRRVKQRELAPKTSVSVTKSAAVRGRGKNKSSTKASSMEISSPVANNSSTRLTTPLSRTTGIRQTKSPSQQAPSTNAKQALTSTVKGKLSGGYHLRTISGSDKENQTEDRFARDHGLDTGAELEEMTDETTPKKSQLIGKQKAITSKWDEIDNWSMDYEDVEVMTSSSSPMRR